MKLMIQIPCFNEEKCLPVTLAALPRSVLGFDTVEWVVIDDGSSDKTAEVAKSLGVHHVIKHIHHQGLSKAFMTGISTCIKNGADVIVNTDADNQYDAKAIPKLVEPILSKKADLVIGVRDIDNIPHFSWLKKQLQKLGSWVVRVVSETKIQDASSGFRAFSKNMAGQLFVFNDYTYTLETLIQAGQLNMAIESVRVQTNADLRPSRLIRNIPCHVLYSAITIFQIFLIYRPFKFLSSIAIFFMGSGLIVCLRFLYFFINAQGSGHVQSLILAAILFSLGAGTLILALLAEVAAANRRLTEDIRNRLSSLGH